MWWHMWWPVVSLPLSSPQTCAKYRVNAGPRRPSWRARGLWRSETLSPPKSPNSPPHHCWMQCVAPPAGEGREDNIGLQNVSPIWVSYLVLVEGNKSLQNISSPELTHDSRNVFYFFTVKILQKWHHQPLNVRSLKVWEGDSFVLTKALHVKREERGRKQPLQPRCQTANCSYDQLSAHWEECWDGYKWPGAFRGIPIKISFCSLISTRCHFSNSARG